MDHEMFLASGIQPWQWDGISDQAHSHQFDSGLSSIVSSPAVSNLNISASDNNNAAMIRELIGKLGTIRDQNVSPGFNNSADGSCYGTPMSSPPKVMRLPVLPLNNNIADLSGDPGFAERAARFSCFGSRSFNGRTGQMGLTNPEILGNYGVNSLGRMNRVSSSPSLKALGARQHAPGRPDIAGSPEESSVSGWMDNGPKAVNDVNSRKRKATVKGKGKESAIVAKVAEDNEDSDAKRRKPNEVNGIKIGTNKADDDEKKAKVDDAKKQPDPPKDYIHVRARRGQATDSHSLAERVRREKISERMKLLQDLVPGCNKVIGKALMLDEIINYVQSLQRQVEFLSMKLATVNTSMDLTMDALVPNKDMYQPNNSVPNPPMFPLLDSSAFHGQNVSDGTLSHCNLDPSISMAPYRSLDADLQFQNFCGGDLQSIVQMGFDQTAHQDSAYSLQSFQGSSQASQMKVEL